MAIGTQIGFAIGGFAPTAAAAIAGGGADGWVPVAAYVLASSVIAAIAVATRPRDRTHVSLREIDGRAGQAPARPVAARREPARERVASG